MLSWAGEDGARCLASKPAQGRSIRPKAHRGSSAADGPPLDLAGLLRDHFARLRQDLTHETDRERAVHRSRRHIKTMRGLLRLAWPERGDRAGAVDDLDRALKSLADHLAPARDDRVAARLAADLAARCKGETADWLARLAHAAHLAATRHETNRAGRARHTRAMRAIDAQLEGLRWPRTPRELSASLARWHARSSRRLGEALATGDAEALHGARTAVVRVLVQVEELSVRTGGFRGRIRGLDRLRSLLGDHHDLELLARRIAAAPGSDAERGEALRAVARQQRRLEAAAARLHARWHGPPGRVGRKVLLRLVRSGPAAP